MTEQNNTTNSLAHTKWNCKYHIVFAPKYRRKVFYAEKREDIREIIRTLCQWKGVEIIEGEVCPDYIHLLLSIPLCSSTSSSCRISSSRSYILSSLGFAGAAVSGGVSSGVAASHAGSSAVHAQNSVITIAAISASAAVFMPRGAIISPLRFPYFLSRAVSFR